MKKALSNNQAQTTLTWKFLYVDICVCYVRLLSVNSQLK